MGLDMYLSKRYFINSDDRKKLKVKGTSKPVDPKRVETIAEEWGYWRKANAIHQWFVDNVQDGNDDCKSYWVSKEKLEQLLETVNKVLEASVLVDGEVSNGYSLKDGQWAPILEKGKIVKDPSVAQLLLPTQSGFFFGSTEYDQYYVADLKETKRIIEEALDGDDGTGDFYYQSSW